VTNPHFRKLGVLISGALLTLALTPSSAEAQYLDPGAGSVIIQAVLAVMIGVTAGIKLYWGKITGFLSRRSKSSR
jgi:hypothetical protein